VGGKRIGEPLDTRTASIKESKGLNKNELDDFVHTVKAARTAQKVVAVVDQHPNLCLFFTIQ
jgi:hypothetical protein